MPTPPKSGAVPSLYFLVQVRTVNGIETRAYKARSVADVLSKVRSSSAIEALNIKEVPFATYERHRA